MVKGQTEKAKASLRCALKVCGKALPEGDLVLRKDLGAGHTEDVAVIVGDENKRGKPWVVLGGGHYSASDI